MDNYGFLSIGQKLQSEITLGEDNRKEYVVAKKEYVRAIIMLSDRLDTLTDIDYSLLETGIARVGYTMQRFITTLASQAPSDETFNPYTNTAEQLTTGMEEWSKDIEVNTKGYMESLKIDQEQVTMYGLDCFVNSLFNIDTPDVILSVYLSLVNYLTKFEITNIEQINKSIIEL